MTVPDIIDKVFSPLYRNNCVGFVENEVLPYFCMRLFLFEIYGSELRLYE